MPKYAVQPKPLPDGVVDMNNRTASKEEFAKRLYQRMHDKGWTQSQLARYANLNRDAISTYIRARSLPSPENLGKLAKCLGCKPEELLPNYFEAAAQEQASKIELRDVHGEDGYMWLKVNMRLPKETAIKVFMLINEADK